MQRPFFDYIGLVTDTDSATPKGERFQKRCPFKTKLFLFKKLRKHPQLNMNPALTLPDVRPLATLCVFLFVSSLPARAFPSNDATTPKTFADWCLNQANSSRETLQTIDAMLQEAKTQDCHQAEKLL